MTSFFIKTMDSLKLNAALQRMTEYAMFLAEDDAFKDRIDYVQEILKEENVDFEATSCE